jgi:hypothetical protein
MFNTVAGGQRVIGFNRFAGVDADLSPTGQARQPTAIASFSKYGGREKRIRQLPVGLMAAVYLRLERSRCAADRATSCFRLFVIRGYDVLALSTGLKQSGSPTQSKEGESMGAHGFPRLRGSATDVARPVWNACNVNVRPEGAECCGAGCSLVQWQSEGGAINMKDGTEAARAMG